MGRWHGSLWATGPPSRPTSSASSPSGSSGSTTTCFKNFSEIDRTLLFLNLLLLFFVVAIPFATATVAAYLGRGGADASLAAEIFQGVFEGMSLSFGLMFWWSIRREHLKIARTPAGARPAIIRFGIGNVAYAVAIGIAFLSAPAGQPATRAG